MASERAEPSSSSASSPLATAAPFRSLTDGPPTRGFGRFAAAFAAAAEDAAKRTAMGGSRVGGSGGGVDITSQLDQAASKSIASAAAEDAMSKL